MADDEFGEKTEAPTPKRRQQAREQGNIARSPDLSAAVLIIGIVLLLNSFGGRLVMAMRSLLGEMLSAESFKNINAASIPIAMLRAVLMIGGALMPLFVGVVLIAVLVNVLQVGFYLNVTKLQPNIAALNPMKGLGKLFGGQQQLEHIGMSLLKLVVVGAVAYSAVHNKLAQIVSVQQLTFIQIFGFGAELIYSITLRIGVVLAILALIDYAYQRFRIEKELKMSKQEVKEEMRSMDGDPKIKQRRREIAKQIAYNKMKKEVPKADVVVTNPTEFAIALKYEAGSMHAPRVVAKGQGYMAMKIREIAVAHGIPILERKPLARALYKLVHVGGEIPEEFYSAVAEILAYVYELTGKTREKQAAVAAR